MAKKLIGIFDPHTQSAEEIYEIAKSHMDQAENEEMDVESHRLSKNSVSLAGEFAVLSQLALRGFDANMTLGNTKGVDILAADPKNGRTFKIEVKTSFGKKPSRPKDSGIVFSWIVSDKAEKLSDPNLFYCFVNIEHDTNVFRFFIVPSSVVAEFVSRGHKNWLQEDSTHKDTSMRQFRIGLEGKNDYKIDMPLAKEYENKWEFSW